MAMPVSICVTCKTETLEKAQAIAECVATARLAINSRLSAFCLNLSRRLCGYRRRAYFIIGLTLMFSWCLPAWSHPSCDVARSERYLTARYPYKITARTKISVISNDNGIEFGSVSFSSIRYKKWPKSNIKRNTFFINYTYDYDSECDWRPDPIARKFILGVNDNNKLYIVRSF